MTIWKYELIGSELEIEVPSFCQKKPLKIRYIEQQDKLEIWFMVDPESPLEKRKFRIIGTGHSVPKNAEYIDTFFDGGYVWHLFEEYFKMTEQNYNDDINECKSLIEINNELKFDFKKEFVVAFDCDDTLVMWNADMSWTHKEVGALQFNSVENLQDPKWVYLKPHNGHIEKLKQLKKQGYAIVVWSAGGAWWAREVVRVLQLKEYVDVTMAKPVRCYDDVQPNAFLDCRYLPYE